MASRRSLSLLLATALTAGLVPLTGGAASAQEAPSGDYQQTLDVSFPTRPVSLSDTYDACRSGCARVHKAADLMGERMWPLYAMVDGVVCRIDDGEEDSYGRHLTLCGDDDRRYRYLHMNNDTPGTDDGAAALEHVFAPGIRRGVRVARGQLLGYMGDSGNAEDTAPHLHLDIFDDRVVDPYGDNRINPYPSLVAALARGDLPDGSAFHADPASRVAGDDRIATAVALARQVPVGGDTVVLARHDHPTDALVAGPLAALLDAPVLITRVDELDARVTEEIRRRGATSAIVVGRGIGEPVTLALAALGLDVERLAGADVYATAEVVAARIWELQGIDGDTEDTPSFPEGDVIVPSAEPTPDGPFLAASTSSDRRDPAPLDGAVVGGSIAVFLDPEILEHGWIEQVTFWLDDQEVNREGRSPYDLLGTRSSGQARRLDTSQLPPGEHVVTAHVRFTSWALDQLPEELGGELTDGLEVTATFAVAEATPERPARQALLALGDHADPSRQWPDALMGSWLGAATATPVLLTPPDEIPSSTWEVLDELDDVTLIGGPGAIPDALIEGLSPTTHRLWGDDRYGTAVAVAQRLVDRDLADTERVWAATGRNWPDAIAAGPAVASTGDLLVLVDGAARGTSQETSGLLHTFADRVLEGIVIGGANAVADTAMQVFRMDLT